MVEKSCFLGKYRRRNGKTGEQGRHHLHETMVQGAVRAAVCVVAGIGTQAGCHTFRHSFATHLLEAGYDLRTMKELQDQKDVRTIMIYTHVLNRGTLGVRSPLDAWERGLYSLAIKTHGLGADRAMRIAASGATPRHVGNASGSGDI